MPLLFRGRRAAAANDVEGARDGPKANGILGGSTAAGLPHVSVRRAIIVLVVLTVGSFVSACAFRKIGTQLSHATTVLIADNIVLDRSAFAKAGANTALRESIAAPLRRLTSERQAPGHLAAVKKHTRGAGEANLSFAKTSCAFAWRRAPLAAAAASCPPPSADEVGLMTLFTTVAGSYGEVNRTAAAAASAGVPAVVVDNTDCFMGPTALTLETPTHSVMPQERPLATSAGFDCYAWARFGADIMARGNTSIVQPELPLNFAQSHAYVARLAEARGLGAYMFAHSDADVQYPAVFHRLRQLVQLRANLFGSLQPCAMLTNYDVLAVYFPGVLRTLGGGSDGVPGFDWRLWYFGDNDLASRCHDAGLPFVTLPQLAPFVGHVRSGTLKSGLPGDSDTRLRRYDFFARYYSWKWQARLRVTPAQERVRVRIPLKALAVELSDSQSLSNVVDAISAAFEACCQRMQRPLDMAFTCRGGKPVQVRLVSPDLDKPGWQTWVPSDSGSGVRTAAPAAPFTGRWRVAMVMLALNSIDRSPRGSPANFFARVSSLWERACSTLSTNADRCDAACEAALGRLCSGGAIIAFEHAHEPIVGADLAP